MSGRTEDLCTAALTVLSVGITRLGPSQRPALGGLHTVWHLDCTGGDHSHSMIFFFFFNLLPLVLYHSIYFCLCNSQSVFLPLSSLFSLLPWRGPQVVVTRERMMNSSTTEPADSLAAGPSPCSLHPLLTSSPFFFSFSSHHLSPHFSLAALLNEGAEGHLHVQRRVTMNGDTSQQSSGY